MVKKVPFFNRNSSVKGVKYQLIFFEKILGPAPPGVFLGPAPIGGRRIWSKGVKGVIEYKRA